MFIRTDRLGETVLNLPAVTALKSTHPGASLTLLVHPDLAELLRDFPGVAQVLAAPERGGAWWWRAWRLGGVLRRQRFDVAIVSNPKKELHLAVWLAGIRWRIGYDRKWGCLLTHRLAEGAPSSDRHEVERNLELVRPLGVAEGPVPRRFAALHQEQGYVRDLLAREGFEPDARFIAVHPWTSNPVKQWPAERFRALVQRIASTLRVGVVIVGGPEARRSDGYATPSIPGVLDVTGRLTLRQLAALLERAQLLVSNDSGPVHVSAAVGTPTVVLFGVTSGAAGPRRWGPWGAGHSVIAGPSIEAISVEEVFAAVARSVCATMAPPSLADATVAAATPPHRPMIREIQGRRGRDGYGHGPRKGQHRILIVNPFGIGDVLFTTPLVRAIRRAFPGSYLTYLCNRRTEKILQHNPNLDELVVYEKDEFIQRWRQSWRSGVRALVELLRHIWSARFDLAIDLSLGERYGLVLRVMGIPRRIGFDYRGRGRFLTERLAIDGYQDCHVVEYHCRLLRFIGVNALDPTLELLIGEAEERWTEQILRAQGLSGTEPLIGIVPAGGASWGLDAPFRRWHMEGFARVGDALARRFGARILLFGEATDRSVCEAVARRMREPAINLSGQTDVGQFVSLLGRLALVICNDGGPLHLAVSRGVKTVSVFGPVDPTVYGPYPPDERRHRVMKRDELPCRPCYHRFKLPPCPYDRACLTTIEVEDVIEECVALLEEKPAGLPAEPGRRGPAGARETRDGRDSLPR